MKPEGARKSCVQGVGASDPSDRPCGGGAGRGCGARGPVSRDQPWDPLSAPASAAPPFASNLLAGAMKTKNVNLLMALVAVLLFGFSCFCISRMNQISNQLMNCRNHILEFKENMLRLKNKSENNHQNLVKVLNQMKYDITQRGMLPGTSVEKKVGASRQSEMLSNRFEDLKFFLPYLRKQGKIYPEVVIGKEKRGVSFALGIPTVNRKNQTYLKQTLTSLLSRMTPEEEQDSVVIVSVADTNEDYLNSVVDMVKTKFKRQVMSGSLEVISIPTFFYPSTLHDRQTTEDSENVQSVQVKQVLDFCILMLYAQPKARYYLQLEDDIVAKKMYFTKMKDFISSIASKNWFYVEFSVLGFIGKLFRSKDLPEFIHFFLMFYKVKPIDKLLSDIFLVKVCDWGDSPRLCMQRRKETCIQYTPSLFQHVGLHSSFPGREQYLKDMFY